MSTQSNKNSISKLLGAAGIAGASLLLSFPAFALIPTSSVESSAKNQELAQGNQGGSSGDATNQSQPGETTNQSPTEPAPNDPSNEQIPSMPNDSTQSDTPVEPAPAASETEPTNQYYSNSDRLQPGSWLCLNNPNPQCDS